MFAALFAEGFGPGGSFYGGLRVFFQSCCPLEIMGLYFSANSNLAANIRISIFPSFRVGAFFHERGAGAA